MTVITYKAAAAVSAAAALGTLIVACNDVTVPPTEFGQAELIYEYISEEGVTYFYLADVASDGTYLLAGYTHEDPWERGLFLLDPEVGGLELIYSSKEYYFSPELMLSPDKGHVAFAELPGIYVVPVAGGEPRRIYWQGLNPTPAQWIDDETVLIYVIIDYWEIKTVNINTLEVNTLLVHDEAYGPSGGINGISLSPDGKHLFVAGDRREGDEWSPEYYFFQIFDTETWEYEEYRTDCYTNRFWSPDGSKISIFQYSDPQGAPGGYFIYKYFDFATGEEVTVFYSASEKLEFNDVYGGTWSPDGKHFLASEDRDDNILRVFALSAE